VEKDCRACGLKTEDAMDRCRWRKQIGMIDDHDECEWVNVSSGTGSPGLSGQIPQSRKTVVCVCVLIGKWHILEHSWCCYLETTLSDVVEGNAIPPNIFVRECHSSK